MEINRYITIQAIQTRDNTLIPIWDERVIFEKSRDFGNTINIKGDRHDYFQVVECIYDIKTKEVKLGIELDYYPNVNELEFKKGQSVLVEVSGRKLSETIITDIVFDDFDMCIKRGRKFERWDISRFPDTKIEPDSIYAIKHWKPFYVLANGMKTQYNHHLYYKI